MTASETKAAEPWPTLPWPEWKDTCETLHLWTQIVGKVKLALVPFLNEWWNVGFDITASGLTTGLIPYHDRAFEIEFNFLRHQLHISVSDGRSHNFPLTPRSVADFYAMFFGALGSMNIHVKINTKPVETNITTPFEVDCEHASYDAGYAERWWRVLVQTTKILMQHRSHFSGKSSPILFYWGSFDLNYTRFSGRGATMPEGPRFYQLAEDQENVACGFWPGNPNAAGLTYGAPAFYSYTYPAPKGFRDARVRPAQAYFDEKFGEFILRYEDAATSPSPETAILDFFQSTYEVGSSLSNWETLPCTHDIRRAV